MAHATSAPAPACASRCGGTEDHGWQCREGERGPLPCLTCAVPLSLLPSPQGYTGADCADCAVGFEKAASGVCAKTEMEQAAQVGGGGDLTLQLCVWQQ